MEFVVVQKISTGEYLNKRGDWTPNIKQVKTYSSEGTARGAMKNACSYHCTRYTDNGDMQIVVFEARKKVVIPID